MARFNIMDSILCMYPCITHTTSSHEINPLTQALVTIECPFNQTAIIAVSLAPHASGIHQKRRTPLRNTWGKPQKRWPPPGLSNLKHNPDSSHWHRRTDFLSTRWMTISLQTLWEIEERKRQSIIVLRWASSLSFSFPLCCTSLFLLYTEKKIFLLCCLTQAYSYIEQPSFYLWMLDNDKWIEDTLGEGMSGLDKERLNKRLIMWKNGWKKMLICDRHGGGEKGYAKIRWGVTMKPQL